MFAFDLPRGTADFVMGVAASSVTLANLTIRRRVEKTLDLGTGCGVQACLAAAHSKAVVAVDSNPRALGFAALNACLNGLTNVECRAGDRFEPVPGQQFDLIVSNPPFVISPAARYMYRDSGVHADEFCRQVVRAVPGFLREGAFCQLLCNWAHIAGQDWRERLAAWFDGVGCDVWVLRSETHDPPTYAASWIQSIGERDPDAVGRDYDAWMAYYRVQQIEAISFGSITMRRRTTARNWLRTEDAPERMLGPLR